MRLPARTALKQRPPLSVTPFDFICASCTNDHKKKSVYNGHKTVLFSEIKEKGALIQIPAKKPLISPCPKHERELNRYCMKCEQLICRECSLADHEGHKVNFVRGVADEFKEEVLSSLVPLQGIHANITTAIAKVEDSKKEIRDQGKDIAKTITHSFEELRTVLNNREQVLLQQVQEVVGKKVDALDGQQENLQLALATLDHLVWFVEKTAENASDEEFIFMKRQMTSRVQQISRKYRDVKLSPNKVANTFVAIPPLTSLSEQFSVAEIYGPGLKSATTKQVAKFRVHTHDTHNKPTPVQQHVSAELKSLVDGSVLQATVVSQTSSTYELSYTPTTKGRHRLTVRVNNTKIGTFQVFVQHPPTQLGTPVRVIEGVRPYYIAVGDKGELFVTEFSDYRYTVLDAQGRRVQTVGSKGKPPFGDQHPTGIATDGKGNVYLAIEDHKVQKFNRQGEVIKSVGKKGGNVGEFNWPCGVQCHNNRVYVCDRNNGRIQVFDSDLKFTRSFGNARGELKQPWDIDFDHQGNIYIVDLDRNQVLVFTVNGQYLRHFGRKGQGKGELSAPHGLCVSGEYVYVTEEGGNWLVNISLYSWNSVSVFRTSGEFIHSFWKWASELSYPRGIAVNHDGFVFVCCNRDSSCIRVF